jgi:cobalt-zinc-cadmium efflux system membrane fusion protein
VVEEQRAPLVVPKSALQTIGKEDVVFVRTPDGFEKREVTLGRSDGQSTEILFGLFPGEDIAIANTFNLKAELGKSEASHAH